MQRTESVAPAPEPIPLTMIFLAALGSSRAVAAHEVAFEVVRRELPYIFRVALFAQLVRSLEREMVRRFFADDLSSLAAAVAGAGVSSGWPGHGVYGGSVCCDSCFLHWGFIAFRCSGWTAVPLHLRHWLVSFLARNVFWFTPQGSYRPLSPLRFT